jgi:hypothetical protein
MGLILYFILIESIWANQVGIKLHGQLPSPPQFALQELQKVLSEKSIESHVSNGNLNDKPAQIIIEIKLAWSENKHHWKKPESFKIMVDKNKILVDGSDPVGLMYGIYELAEQIDMGTGKGLAVLYNIRETSSEPALEIRADNIFLKLENDDAISPWFYEEEFWKRYFSSLSRNRFNICDIHAMYNLENTSFPDLFPYFVKNPAIPEAALESQDQEKNLAMLNRIIELAEERGVHVSLMDYALDFPGISHGDEDKMITQTSWAVSEILKRCPKLWMFGFRIGESGKSEDFYKRSFLYGIANSGRKNIRLYTRTWLAQFKDLAQIGMKYPENFYIEIKYNGEHLGLPYNAIQGRWGSYSYEKYLNYPRYWKVIWQIRTNGTHRIFPWCDTDFIKRCVQSSTFGNAAGFSLEPITAYYTQDPSRVFKNPKQVDFIDYMFERYWAWYLVWGRLAYNSETPERVFIHEFKKQFGEEAGEQIYRLTNTYSQILPLIYRHHCLGPDHRNMAPEFETGNNTDYKPKQPKIKNIDSFINAGVLDTQTHLSCSDYVEAYLNHTINGKMTPLDVAERLDALAKQCQDYLKKIRVSKNKKEWNTCVNDIEALTNLAKYYAEKDRAACALQFYYRLGDPSQVPTARKHQERAIFYWKELVNVTEGQYKPLSDPLRMGKDFTWSRVLPDLDADLERIAEIEKEIQKSNSVQISHVPVYFAHAREDVQLICGVSGATPQKVSLYYQSGTGSPQKEICSSINRWTFESKIPGINLREGSYLRYWFSAEINGKTLTSPPDGAKNPDEIRIHSDEEGPVITWKSAEVKRKDEFVHIECTIEDLYGIAKAILEWKPMPSDQPWAEPIPLKQIQNNIFSTRVPLTYEGVLYCIVATDNNGNTTRYPNPQTARPYLVVNPWDRGLPPDMQVFSIGELKDGLKGQEKQWEKVSSMGRPGVFYEYCGKMGKVTFPLSVDTYSDYRLTIGTVVRQNYGRAKILIDAKEIDVLNCQLDVGGYVPVQKEFYIPALAEGDHSLSLELIDTSSIGFEGFKLTSRPAMVQGFMISQSFLGFIGEEGKDMYPIGNKNIIWNPADADAEGVVHLDAQLKPNENCHAYAATEILCDKDIETVMRIGHNDGMNVWLNGKIVYDYLRKHAFEYNMARIPVNLKKGKNLLVLLVTQAGRNWMFNVNLDTYDFQNRMPKF